MESSSSAGLKNSLNFYKLIQPELLSVEELIDILRERCVPPNLLSQNKESLVSLFKKVALPLPQRELRQNYRGSLLMKIRKKTERLKIISSEPSVNDSKSFTIGVKGQAALTKRNLEVNDRLRPPPDLVNHGRKKIRLNSSSETSKQTSDLDKVVIIKRKSSESNNHVPGEGCSKISSSEDKADKNGDKTPGSENKEDTNVVKKEGCNGVKVVSVPRKISLKRNHLSSKVSTSTTEDLKSQSVSEPEKKRKPITWP